MSQPIPWLILAITLLGGAAPAQPLSAIPEQNERQVELPAKPSEPAPEVYVAPGVTTLVLFDSPLDRDSLELEKRGPGFVRAEVAESSIILEPAATLPPDVRLNLRIRFHKNADWAVLTLVSRPSKPDEKVRVIWRQDPTNPPKPCATSTPSDWILSGQLDSSGIWAKNIVTSSPADNPSGLRVLGGTGYRAEKWGLIVLTLSNLPGHKAWEPGQVVLTTTNGKAVKVTSVKLDPPQLSAGAEGRLLVETGAPFWEKGKTEVLQLIVSDKNGERSLPIDGVKF